MLFYFSVKLALCLRWTNLPKWFWRNVATRGKAGQHNDNDVGNRLFQREQSKAQRANCIWSTSSPDTITKLEIANNHVNVLQHLSQQIHLHGHLQRYNNNNVMKRAISFVKDVTYLWRWKTKWQGENQTGKDRRYKKKNYSYKTITWSFSVKQRKAEHGEQSINEIT